MGSRGLKVLFDSSIVIDGLNGTDGAREAFKDAEEHYVSVVTHIEVLAGCKSEQSEALARSFLAGFVRLELSAGVAEEAIRIRRSGRLRLPDAIILATARVHGLVLSTRNTRDFSADDPLIRVPYRL